MRRLFEGGAYSSKYGIFEVFTLSNKKNSTENRGLVLLSLHRKTEMIDWP